MYKRSSPTDSTVITMELFFFNLEQDNTRAMIRIKYRQERGFKSKLLYIIIIELADIAKVFTHVDTTVGANLSYLIRE